MFGFEPGESSDKANIFNLQGGGIINNTLTALDDTNFVVPALTKFNYGIFKSLSDRANNNIKQKIYLTGGINITGNKSGDTPTNIPLEQGTNKWFEVYMESDEHILAGAARLAFLPLDITPANPNDLTKGASGYNLFPDNN